MVFQNNVKCANNFYLQNYITGIFRHIPAGTIPIYRLFPNVGILIAQCLAMGECVFHFSSIFYLFIFWWSAVVERLGKKSIVGVYFILITNNHFLSGKRLIIYSTL